MKRTSKTGETQIKMDTYVSRAIVGQYWDTRGTAWDKNLNSYTNHPV